MEEKGVSLVTCTNKKNSINHVFENYVSQTWDNKELIIILNRDDLKIEDWWKKAENHRNVSVYQISEKKTLGECMNFAVEKAKHDYIAKFDDDDYYAPRYLFHPMKAFSVTDADIVGKHSYYAYIESMKVIALCFPYMQNKFVKFLSGATLVMKKKIFHKIRFPIHIRQGGDSEFLKDCVAKGLKIYSTDQYDFCYMRKADKNEHTWKVSDREFLKTFSIVGRTDDYKKIVTK